jgi:signal transduction histidine kinase
MLADILLAISGILLLVLFLGVFLSNSKKPVNRALAGFLLSGFVWLSSNFLANISSSSRASLIFTRSTLIGAALIPLAFLCFAIIYTGYRKITLSRFIKLAFLPLLIILFTPTDLNISSVSPHGKDAVAGPLYLLLIAVLIIYFTIGIYLLTRYYRRTTSMNKYQLHYIFTGLILTLVPGVITNGIFPVIGLSGPSAYGPVSVVFFSIFTTLAIVRHRLLDIRLVVARSMAYVLVLGTLGIAFAAVLLALTSLFFPDASLSTGAKTLYVAVALVLAFLYQPLKRIFDRLTNRIFFRDYYDPQTVLDNLSGLLVGTVDLKRIESGSSRILQETLRPTSIEYLLIAEQLTKNDELLDLLKDLKKDVVLYDELDQNRYRQIREHMAARNVAVAARLKTTHGDLGFITLGFKQSGSVYSDDDVRLLGIVADEIAVGLQNALRFQEIQRFNETLQMKVEDATKQLRSANHRLRELDATKDEFISMASHQLRTPLTTIKGYLSMVLEGDVGPVTKDERKMIQQAFDGAERMVFLIADLLNVSRLQSGKFVIDNKPTDLAKMVETEVSQLQETAKNHKLTLSADVPDKSPLFNLDETKIRQVVMNFLDNAIYYTPAGGSIEAKLDLTDKELRYTVTDTGLGVPKALQHKLFTKFYRADNARKMRPDGTGLGLFMAKKVITAQGGAIIFKSEEGKGSTFGFSFPRHAVEIKASNPVKAEPAAEPVAV